MFVFVCIRAYVCDRKHLRVRNVCISECVSVAVVIFIVKNEFVIASGAYYDLSN